MAPEQQSPDPAEYLFDLLSKYAMLELHTKVHVDAELDSPMVDGGFVWTLRRDGLECHTLAYLCAYHTLSRGEQRRRSFKSTRELAGLLAADLLCSHYKVPLAFWGKGGMRDRPARPKVEDLANWAAARIRSGIGEVLAREATSESTAITTVEWRCSVCGQLAGTYRFVPKGVQMPITPVFGLLDDSVNRILKENFLFGTVGAVPDSDVNAFLRAMRTHDPDFFYRRVAGGSWAPFYCHPCERIYCERHWTTWALYDDGSYEGTRGRCPRGHERTLDD